VWISKARTIFAIEVLAKNIMKYYDYFRHNIKRLRRMEFEDEGLNTSQLAKFMDDLIDHLEDPEKASSVKQKDPTAASPSTQPNSSASPDETPVKSYSQSAVYSSQPGLLTVQLASESAGEDSSPNGPNSADVKPASGSSSGSFLSKFKKNAEAKGQTQASTEVDKKENLIDCLAGLDFTEEKSQPQKVKQEGPNFDDVYNLYLNSHPQHGFGHMQYPNVPNQNMNNIHAQPNTYSYQQYHMGNPYNPQYNPQMAGKNQPHFYQNQVVYGPVPSMSAEVSMTPEDYYKRKQHQDNEKKFDNLKLAF
jgi:hypothetical protein